MTRKPLLLACFAGVLAAQSWYFGSQFIAAVQRQQGQRAFFRNDYPDAWRRYEVALAWGGDAEQLETDMVGLLLAGLDQTEAGVKVSVPIPPAEAPRRAHELLVRRLREIPYRAYSWSLLSDVYFHAAAERRKETPLDLASLSENPVDNLLLEEQLAIVSLEVASRLEPNNYIYADLLVEALLDRGILDLAARYCRVAIAANPSLSDHLYLERPGLPPEMVEAGLKGFEDALGAETMVPRGVILGNAGRLLADRGVDERAIPYLTRAAATAPWLSDTHFYLGLLRYRKKEYRQALIHFDAVAKLLPDSPWAYYYMGMSYLALNETEMAIAKLQAARRNEPHGIGLFHALGEALEGAGRYAEAERQFSAAANLNPKEIGAWEALLAFQVRRKNWRGVADACDRLHALGASGTSVAEQCSSTEEPLQ